MTLILILKILGWIFALVPFITFFVISITMIKGAGKDDPSIQALSLIGLTIFLMGLITLLVVYLSDLF
ncbi:MAG: hypothetical protein UT30_C0005G0004 [Candidatus Uhrbacteria bacterium GW2011_GWF2_39_13]|uniref:Uncharacterized protein n=1 Tax=Candidatus Uhrbacteria bacterium GW2011_GWF2_39_13 TaxID=1618995 RepID=A0A0G0MW18_9BACT|nr:MAG: hypothetical protein UT30_C0005G0004 [Candidatus Uhrbacteria bacterium GW2011_GWF2_39_13]HAU66596.1 hypothetical protein [Candidatus Uhrbacteria bacterium]